MLCDVCRERDATVTLTHAVKGEVNVLHLCQRCAAERGIETTVTTPLKNMIADYLPQVQPSTALAPADSVRCAFCSMSLADFRETGRLGCASCYATFESSLRALLRRGGGDEALRREIAAVWAARDDRYSEIRTAATPRPGAKKIEMSYIGG